MKNFGVLEFETFLIICFMLLDIILGSIDHIFFKKDSSSRGAIQSLFAKFGIATTLITVLFILHANDWGVFRPEINSILEICRNGADGIVIMLLYYELTSLLAHLHNITGLDFSKIPGVSSEIDKKNLKSYEYDEKLRKMKEDKNG